MNHSIIDDVIEDDRVYPCGCPFCHATISYKSYFTRHVKTTLCKDFQKDYIIKELTLENKKLVLENNKLRGISNKIDCTIVFPHIPAEDRDHFKQIALKDLFKFPTWTRNVIDEYRHRYNSLIAPQNGPKNLCTIINKNKKLRVKIGGVYRAFFQSIFDMITTDDIKENYPSSRKLKRFRDYQNDYDPSKPSSFSFWMNKDCTKLRGTLPVYDKDLKY